MFGLILTFLKPFNTAIIIWFLFNNLKTEAAIAIIFLIFCDIFDGILFRNSKLASNVKLSWFRRVSDIIGDRIAVEAVLLIMIIYYQFPLYLYAVEIVREVFLLSIWIYGIKNKRPLREPNLISRLSMFSVGLMAICWLTVPILSYWCLIPIIGFGIPGCIKYWRLVSKPVSI